MVASDTRDPRFESHHQQKFINRPIKKDLLKMRVWADLSNDWAWVRIPARENFKVYPVSDTCSMKIVRCTSTKKLRTTVYKCFLHESWGHISGVALYHVRHLSSAWQSIIATHSSNVNLRGGMILLWRRSVFLLPLPPSLSLSLSLHVYWVSFFPPRFPFFISPPVTPTLTLTCTHKRTLSLSLALSLSFSQEQTRSK